MEDQHIIQRVLGGEQAAYRILVERYQNFVFSIATKVLPMREEAEEAAQDTFVKAYQTLRSFKGQSKFSTWLYTIAYRSAIDLARKKKISTYAIDSEDSFLQLADTKSLNASGQLQQTESRAILQRIIRQLKPDDATIITLYYLEETPVKEIAKITGHSESNVKVKLFRLREALKKHLSKYLKTELNDFIR